MKVRVSEQQNVLKRTVISIKGTLSTLARGDMEDVRKISQYLGASPTNLF